MIINSALYLCLKCRSPLGIVGVDLKLYTSINAAVRQNNEVECVNCGFTERWRMKRLTHRVESGVENNGQPV